MCGPIFSIPFHSCSRQSRYPASLNRMDSWLSANPFETVFSFDLFDVVVNRDPFELFKTPTLFISHQGKKIGETGYFLKNFSRVYGRVPETLLGQPELNAGVWDGGYNEAIRFLSLISGEIQNLATGPVRSYNINIPAFNHVAYITLGARISGPKVSFCIPNSRNTNSMQTSHSSTSKQGIPNHTSCPTLP